MGGARCAYRTCSAKSDPVKRLHMFHFPVFDKVRCHQWMANAQKLDYLDLKLSQLKNRVVCEHHFKDDQFMNFKKDKLKNSAIPTEDGPYCTKPSTNVPDEDKDMPIINVDDIENDVLTNCEKKAHFSMKYGDFLTNDYTNDINVAPSSILPKYNSTSISLEPKGLIFNRIEKINKPKRYFAPTSGKVIKNIKEPDPVASLYQAKNSDDPKVVAIEFEEMNLIEPSSKHTETPTTINPQQNVNQNITPKKTIPSKKKVQIISEKKISEPLPVIKGELQPISPSVIISLPSRKKKHNEQADGIEIETYYLNAINPSSAQEFNNATILSSQPPILDQNVLNDFNNTKELNQFENIHNLQMPKIDVFSHCKREVVDINTLYNNNNKMMQLTQNTELRNTSEPILENYQTLPQVSTQINYQHLPQKVAVANVLNATLVKDSNSIFNISEIVQKSSDISTICQEQKTKHNTPFTKVKMKRCRLPKNNNSRIKIPPERAAAIQEKRKFKLKLKDLIDNCFDKLDDKADINKLTAAMKRQLSQKKVGKHLSEHPNLPTAQENQLAYLEDRLQRMEDNLLNKIDQNSQRIVDLRRAIRPSLSKKSIHTQTYSDATLSKRDLYQQISEYLTPETNSLIYEELFINTVMKKSISSPPAKRRRNRNINKK